MSLKDPDVKPENIIRDYDALFAVRTGLTLLIPKNDTFAGGVDIPVHFRVSSANPRDVLFIAQDRAAIIKDVRQEYLDAAIKRGTIMIYEMQGEDMVRCTPCIYHTT